MDPKILTAFIAKDLKRPLRSHIALILDAAANQLAFVPYLENQPSYSSLANWVNRTLSSQFNTEKNCSHLLPNK